MFLAHLSIGLNVILLPFPRETKEVSPFTSNRNLDLSFWRYNELPISTALAPKIEGIITSRVGPHNQCSEDRGNH